MYQLGHAVQLDENGTTVHVLCFCMSTNTCGADGELRDREDDLTARYELINRGIHVSCGTQVKLSGALSTVKCHVRFAGRVSGKKGTWVGVELDGPIGKNNGSAEGKYYFNAPENHGLFVRPEAVIRADAIVEVVLDEWNGEDDVKPEWVGDESDERSI